MKKRISSEEYNELLESDKNKYQKFYLDEIFSPGIGEDTSQCIEAQLKGWTIVQVPDDNSHDFYGDLKRTGNYPIWHEGTQTFSQEHNKDDGLIKRNSAILKQRYNPDKGSYLEPYKEVWEDVRNAISDDEKPSFEEIAKQTISNSKGILEKIVDISKAENCDGYISSTELVWLAENAKDKKTIISIGEWHGRSTRAIADNMPKDGKFYAIDHWLGSEAERTNNHASAALAEGDHAFLEFCDNLFDHIQQGRVIPLRMSSKNAAEFLKRKGIKADMIFIDAGHTKPEVLEDIAVWEPLVKDGGILCGHDYYHDGQTWPGVMEAVDSVFGQRGTDMGYLPDNSIWRHTINKRNPLTFNPTLPSDIQKHYGQGITKEQFDAAFPKPDVYDCFPFNNEFDILERRFKELYDVVDRFVIVEATLTHGNEPKALYFKDNLQRFEKYLDKVTHIVIDQFPATDSWSIERFQREGIMKGLTECADNDIVIISDADEIPTVDAINRFQKSSLDVASLEMELYYYNEHCRAVDKWKEGKIVKYGILKQSSPCEIRYRTTAPVISNAGKHLSYFGDTDAIVKKIENTAHREYSTDYFKNKDRILKCINEGRDIFERNDVKFENVI